MTNDDPAIRSDSRPTDRAGPGPLRRSGRRDRNGRPLLSARAAGSTDSLEVTQVCDRVRGTSPARLVADAASGSVVRVVMTGEVDLDNRAATELRLLQSCAAVRSGDVVICDLDDLTFMDVAGSEVLASLNRELGARGALVVVRGARPTVRLVLQVTGQLGGDTLVLSQIPATTP